MAVVTILGNVWYISSVAWTAVPAWTLSTAIAAGALRRQVAPAAFSEAVFVCIVAGTTGGTEPSATTWTAPAKGAKTAADGGVTWQECTGQPGVNNDLTNCPNWTAVKNLNPGLGKVIKNNAGTFLFICSTAGLTGNGAEPAWTLTAGVATVDNAATWTCIGAVAGFGKYAAPHARIRNAQTWGAAGDTFFVADNHAATSTGANNLSSLPPPTLAAQCYYYCVDHLVVPPTETNLKTTASEACTGSATLTVGAGYYYGITFKDGSGANFVGLNISPGSVPCILDNCALQGLDTAASGSKINFSSVGARAYCRMVNTTVQFGNVGDGIAVDDSFHVRWEDTPSAITGATIPNSLFGVAAANSGSLECEGIDFSALGVNTIFGSAGTAVRVTFINCKLGAGWWQGDLVSPGARFDILNSDSSGANIIAMRSQFEGYQYVYQGILFVKTGGAGSGATPFGWKMQTYANTNRHSFFQSMCMPVWNSVLSTNRVVTVAGIWFGPALPNNDDIWLHCEYLGSAASPISSRATQTVANGFTAGSPLPADTASAWDSLIAARINTTAYVVGNSLKVASNPGRIFSCTTAGTSAGSEPAGYASAVDGGSVTDGTAVFRAAVRFSLTVTLSSPQPAQAGYIGVYVRTAKPSSGFYIDPLPVLS